MPREASQKEWYERYHSRVGLDRNNLLTNRGVLFQTLAIEASVVKAAYNIRFDPRKADVLDVGCGGGGDLYHLLRLGYDPKRITGIEIQLPRIEEAKALYPHIHFIQGDATCIYFETSSFDLVFESTLFVTLPDGHERAKIASEMIRVCRPEGYLLLVDWRFPKIGDPAYKALGLKQLQRLFRVGIATHLVGVYKGALVPPVGRFLSTYAHYLYFAVGALFPFLVGQVAYLLRKKSG